jgi:hypothetical protein
MCQSAYNEYGVGRMNKNFKALLGLVAVVIAAAAIIGLLANNHNIDQSKRETASNAISEGSFAKPCFRDGTCKDGLMCMYDKINDYQHLGPICVMKPKPKAIVVIDAGAR